MNYDISKRKLWCILLACGVATGQPFDVRVRASYPTQTVLCGTVNPAASYTLNVMADGITIPDVDNALFPGSNQDTNREDTVTNGTERCVVIGHRVYGTTAAGTVVSRATEADKVHSYNWGGSSGTFTTPTIPLNNSHSDPWQVMGTTTAVPTLAYTDRTQFFIDPLTGTRIKRWDTARQEIVDYTSPFTASEQGTGWMNPSNLFSNTDSSAYASYSGTAQDWLYIRGKLTPPGQQLGEIPEADFIGLTLSGYCSGSDCATAASRLVDVQMTLDGVNWSSTYQLSLPNGSEGAVSSYGPGGSSGVAGKFWIQPVALMTNWAQPEGLIYNLTDSTTVAFTVDSDCDAIRVGDAIYTAGISARTVVSIDCGASPRTMTLNDHLALTPPSGMSGWPFRYANGWLNNSKVGFRIRKNSTVFTNAELRIQYAYMNMGTSDQIRGSSGGFAEHCNNNPTEHGRHLCVFGDNLYSLEPETGEVIFMGSAYMSCPGVYPEVWGSQGSSWSTVNPRRLYVGAVHSSGDLEPAVVMVDITQDDLTTASGFSVFSVSQPGHNCVDLTPTGHGLTTLVSGYDAHFNRALYIPAAVSTLAGDRVLVMGRRHGQDTYTYLAIFDTGNQQPVGSGGTGGIIAGFYIHEGPCNLATEFCMAWMGLHTTFSLDDAPGWVAFQQSGPKNEQAGGNALGVTLQNYWTGSSWAPGLPVQAPLTETELQITTAWNPAWGAQPAGFIPGDPVSDCIPGGCSNAVDNTGDYWHGPLKAGMTLCRNYFTPECMLITEITSPTQIKVKRGYGTPDSFYNPQAWNSGDKLYIQSKEVSIAAIAWNYGASPHGTDSTAFVGMKLPGGGHTVVKNTYASGSPDQVTRLMAGGLNAITTQYITGGDVGSAFQIKRAAVFGGNDANEPGDCTEGHLSVAHERGSALTNVDIHPTIGGAGCWNSGTTTATLVSWPIYKWSGLNVHPKQFPILGMAGDKVLTNISGPGAMLTSSPSDWYKVCYALIAGECYTGSAAGDMYVSAPNARPGAGICSVFATALDDLCVGDFPSDTSRVNVYTSPTITTFTNPAVAKDSLGTAVLSTVGMRGKPASNTSNAKLLPGANWAFHGGGFPRAFGLLAKMPSPWTKDGVDRTTWVGRTITIRAEDLPMGTASVAVKFGYAFCPDAAADPVNCSGSDPNHPFYCSKSRAESCYAVTPTIDMTNPYVWSTEWNPAAQNVPCAIGCTVELPTAYGNVVHAAVVYLDSMGVQIGTGPRLLESAAAAKAISIRGDARIRGDLR